MATTKTCDVRTAYLEGRSIAALARDHGVSRGAIRTAVADLLPDHTATEEAAAPELPVTLGMPFVIVRDAGHVVTRLARVLRDLPWDRVRPRLTHRSFWPDHRGEPPLAEGPLMRLKVEHPPKDRDAPPVWSDPGTRGFSVLPRRWTVERTWDG